MGCHPLAVAQSSVLRGAVASHASSEPSRKSATTLPAWGRNPAHGVDSSRRGSRPVLLRPHARHMRSEPVLALQCERHRRATGAGGGGTGSGCAAEGAGRAAIAAPVQLWRHCRQASAAARMGAQAASDSGAPSAGRYAGTGQRVREKRALCTARTCSLHRRHSQADSVRPKVCGSLVKARPAGAVPGHIVTASRLHSLVSRATAGQSPHRKVQGMGPRR